MLSEAAPAKVNLFLHVTGLRPDGYHLLDSLAVFPGAGDVLHAGPSGRLSLSITGPCGGGLDAGEDNLVLRAARLLAETAGHEPRAALVLDKRLPVASGIGGGSADAAAALRLLSRAWGLGPPPAELALRLGADVPVCLESRPAVMRGIGEVLTPAPTLPEFGMLLVNPGFAVATQAVFRARRSGVTPPVSLPSEWLDAVAMAATLAQCRNDLEAAALTLYPGIGGVLDWIRSQRGCLLARMSGSGATCFGLFPTGAEAVTLVGSVPGGWWAWGGSCETKNRSVDKVQEASKGFTDRLPSA